MHAVAEFGQEHCRETEIDGVIWVYGVGEDAILAVNRKRCPAATFRMSWWSASLRLGLVARLRMDTVRSAIF